MGYRKANIKLAKAFLKRAEGDLRSAKILLDAGEFPDSIYHSQQCSEKAIKALLVMENKFVRQHIVSGIFKEVIENFAEKWKEKLIEILPDIESLEIHWILPRYPEPFGEEIWNPEEEYSEKDAKEAFAKAERILKILKAFLKENYKI